MDPIMIDGMEIFHHMLAECVFFEGRILTVAEYKHLIATNTRHDPVLPLEVSNAQ